MNIEKAGFSGYLPFLFGALGVIIAVLIMNAILGTVQHVKAQKSLDSLKQLQQNKKPPQTITISHKGRKGSTTKSHGLL